MYKLYNGCPNKALADLWKSNDNAREALDKAVKLTGGIKGWITYFPVEQTYSASMYDANDRYICLTPDFHSDVVTCSNSAIKFLKVMS